MAITANPHPVEATKIYVSRQDNVNLEELREKLIRLSENGGITDRDERLFEYLRELGVLSIDQIHRLMFPKAKQRTAYQRMVCLSKSYLLGGARVPRGGMKDWGLPVGKVYSLGAGGRLWLMNEVNNEHVSRYLKRDQVLHDLLVAEVCVRLIESVYHRGENWSITWVNERSASFYAHERDNSPVIIPDGLAIVRQQRKGGKAASLPFFIELDASRESHGRLSSDWGRKVLGYDQFRGTDDKWKLHPQLMGSPNFPMVVVITHGEQRLLNLAAAINEKRKNQVVYYLALWEDLVGSDRDFLKSPAWLVLMPDGQLVGENREERIPLLDMA